MMSYRQAMDAILKRVRPLGVERVTLAESFGRVLGRSVCAPWDMPRFNQSAMDGFAVVADDVAESSEPSPTRLRPIGVQHIGRPCRHRVIAGTTVKLSTGSMLPEGADAVVMREFVREEDGVVCVARPVVRGENVRLRGEEYRKGDEVLPVGTRITLPVMGMLASLNRTAPAVYRRPTVTCIVTGDELASPGERLRPGRIYDANSWSLHAAIRGHGVSQADVKRVRDEEEAVAHAIRAAFESSDIVVTVGGASVGDYDFVRRAARRIGVSEVFWQVNVKPGKPVLFGTYAGRRMLFGLPGNAVSALVSFHRFVRPAILAMSGQTEPAPGLLRATFRGTFRKKADRLEWVRGTLSGDSGRLEVRATAGQDSHMLGGLAAADCLVEFPEPSTGAQDGDEVGVIPLRWRL